MKLGNPALYIGKETDQHKVNDKIIFMGMGYEYDTPVHVFRNVVNAVVLELNENEFNWMEENK
ncbi:hypothetical protein [Psychrobacillus phage Perkons]|nr:hypothetical protein [Psychrobacillus phage Perkons]